mgnify:CR=1 FL=1
MPSMDEIVAFPYAAAETSRAERMETETLDTVLSAADPFDTGQIFPALHGHITP